MTPRVDRGDLERRGRRAVGDERLEQMLLERHRPAGAEDRQRGDRADGVVRAERGDDDVVRTGLERQTVIGVFRRMRAGVGREFAEMRIVDVIAVDFNAQRRALDGEDLDRGCQARRGAAVVGRHERGDQGARRGRLQVAQIAVAALGYERGAGFGRRRGLLDRNGRRIG